jgi:hypothetical protein
LKSVKPADLQEVIRALLTAAKAGDVPAAKELMQRLLGPPESLDLLARLDALEAKIQHAVESGVRSWQN